jgi:DNA repair protein RadC
MARPCGTWIKRERQAGFTHPEKFIQLGSLHDLTHELAEELVEQHSAGHIKYADLNALRELFKEMHKIAACYLYRLATKTEPFP